jgi:hypothetical protein
MYVLYRELAEQAVLSPALLQWRDTLVGWAACPGSGCIDAGLDDYPDDSTTDPVARTISGAQSRQRDRLIAADLAQARVAVGDDPGAEQFWRGVEEDQFVQGAVSMILAAFLELVTGRVDPRYGQLVHPIDSDDANSRTLPFEDVRVTRARSEARFDELLQRPPSSSNFGADANVRFVPRDDRTTGES